MHVLEADLNLILIENNLRQFSLIVPEVFFCDFSSFLISPPVRGAGGFCILCIYMFKLDNIIIYRR